MTTGELLEQDPFGWCPECGKSGEYLNIERDHYFYCDAHRTKWYGGSNLFSSWRYQDEATWAQNARHLEHYRDVDPYTPTPAMLARVFASVTSGEAIERKQQQRCIGCGRQLTYRDDAEATTGFLKDYCRACEVQHPPRGDAEREAGIQILDERLRP